MPNQLLVWKILGGVIISIAVNVNGLIKQLAYVSTNVNGTLKNLFSVHANVNGTLKQILSSIPDKISGSCSGSTAGVMVAANVVLSTSCTVFGKITLSPYANSGPAVMLAVDSDGVNTTIFNKTQSVNTGAEFSGSALLSPGTYSFKVIAYNFGNNGVGVSPNVSYSISFG